MRKRHAARRFIAGLLLSLGACGPNNPATDDMSVQDLGGCNLPNVLRYEQPGCGMNAPAPVCGDPGEDLCLRFVCSCAGKVIGGCDYYAQPWARGLDPRNAKVGDPCDPTPPDLAQAPQPEPCGGITCAANELCLYICDCCGIPTDMAKSHYQCVPDRGQCSFAKPQGHTFSDPNAPYPCACESQRKAGCYCQ